MHDTKMFLFTHRYGFELGFSVLFFPSETWFTGLEVDWGTSRGSRGLAGESAAAPVPAGRGVSHIIFVPFSPCCPRGDVTPKHNLTPQFHCFSSIRLDWKFPCTLSWGCQMSCQSCVRGGPCSSALIHHTAFYMDQYEWDSLHQRQQLLHWDAGDW